MAFRTQVISGPRSPKDNPERQEAVRASMLDLAKEALESAMATERAETRPPGMRCFGSPYRNFMLTIKRSDEREINGVTIPARLQTVVFQDCLLRTDDPVVIAAIESHRQYGRDVWDADEMKLRAERAAGEDFLARVDKLPPDLLDRLRVKLGMEDFSMTPPAPAGSEQAPTV